MDIGSIFSKKNLTFVIMLVVVMYLISHYSQDLCDAIGLTYKGTV